MGIWAAIKKWLEPNWPEGEPAITPGGLRYGTVLPSGAIILADGFRIERLPEKQTVAAPRHQTDTDHVKKEA